MPTYEISAPDGSKYQIEGPEGATQDQVIREVLRQNPLAGQTTEELKKAPSAPFSLSDIARSGGTGVVSGLGALTAVGGASSTPTKYLDEKTQALQSGLSPQRLAEMQRREEIIKRAEESGSTWEKIKAGAGAVAEAPLQSLAQGLGSAVTPAAAAVAAVVAAPASIAAGVGIAAAGFVGLLMGAGGSKQEINERVRREFEKAGDPPDVAARKADEAQSWTGENLDQIMINAGAGALEGATGVGRVAAGAARSARGLKALPTKPLTAPTKIGTVAGSALEEAAPELIQSLAGTAAGNIAATRAGFQTDTFEGATSAATRDALIGALTGAAVSPVQYKSLQGDFLRQQNEEATKKQEEFQKQREEFAQKYQQQQKETKKNLGLNMLALPAPAATVEEKYRNPAATITREELGEQEVNGKKIKSEALQYLDDYRKANNLPALKAYSIEDIQDAMPGLNPEGEKGILDSILAGKYGYKPVDETTGNEIKYTSDDVLTLAEEEKNIATGTQGFKDFLTSVTGTDNVGEMSQPQLHAAYSALQNFEPAEETRILPEGTAATRFSQKQYDNALKVVNVEFASVDNKPLDPKVIAKEIKESTGLENDRDALALLDTAVKNGDLTFSTKPVFRVVDPATGQFVHTALTRAKAEKFAEGKNLNIIGDSQSYISPAEQDTLPDRTPLPAGYKINQERVVEGEQDLVDVMREGKGQPLDTIAVDKAQERIDTLTGESKELAAKALKRIESDSAMQKRIQKNLDQMVAKGEGNTSDFKIQKTRSESAITNLRLRIEKNLAKIEELSAPLKTRKSEVKKPIIKKKLTVTKDGKAIGTFSQDEIGKANAQAQDAILTQMTDEEIQAAIDDKKLGLFREKAKKEQDRRRGPTGFKITKAKTPETLSPEFVDKAEEIKKRLVPMLQRFGLGNVGLNIVNAIKNNAEGSYLNSLIQVAVDATSPVQTMRHEALHALKDLGFFSDSQWQALTNKAKTEWIDKYLKGQNVEVDGKVMSRYDGYVYINQTEPAAWNKANPDKPARAVMSDAALNELLVEEAIADAFGDFDANGSPAGMVAAILKRLNQFFEALRNAITGAGFQTAEDIFGKVERGELKGTKETTAEEEKLSTRPTSDIGHKREASTGRYVGAPDWVGDSPQRLTALRKKLKKLAVEGEVGRYWYENSSQAVMDMTGNKKDAEKFVGLLAIYSAHSTVSANTSKALNAWYQYKTGQPVNAGDTIQDKKAEELLRQDKYWSGIKTNSFYQNLMIEIDPSKIDPKTATMDMWMAIAFDYGSEKLDQGPKYGFALRETQRLAEELGWTPHQTQAAIWTAIKGRVEATRDKIRTKDVERGNIDVSTGKNAKPVYILKPEGRYDHYRLAHQIGMDHNLTEQELLDSSYDFATALDERTAQVSWEATPGETTGVLPGLLKAPTKQKLEYLEAVSNVLRDQDGNDAIAVRIGLPAGKELLGFSAWKGDIGAGVQSFFPASVEGVGERREARQEAKDLLNLYANIRGFVLIQEAVVWHIPMFDGSKKNQNGYEGVFNEPLTEAEMKALYTGLHEKFGTWEIAPGYTENGFRALNFTNVDNKTFQRGIREVLASMPKDFGNGQLEGLAFRSTGDYIGNDWAASPQGEDYARNIASAADPNRPAGSPDLQTWAADLRSRVEKVNEDFSQKYNWGKPKLSLRVTEALTRPSVSGEGIVLGEKQPASMSYRGIHYGQAKVDELDGKKFGTGIRGAERRRLEDAFDDRIKNRVYFYITKPDGTLPLPESGLGGYVYTQQFDNILPPGSEMSKMFSSVNGDANNFETAVIDAGYDGYAVPSMGMMVVLNHNTPVKYEGTRGDLMQKGEKLSLRSTRQPPESKEFKQWFGESFFVDDEGNPVIVYHGTARDITIFKGKQAKAIFVTTEPKVAETYADMGVDYMRTEAYKALTRDEKVELITVVAEQAERDGTITKAELKEIQSNLKKRVPPIDSEKNRIIDLPYQIEGEIIESLNNLLPTKGNIMPVYVNARNVFDYANKDHVNQVYNWMMNNSRALGRMQNPEDWLKSVKGLISRGNWVRIESEDVQEAIRALDFDGFSVLEAGTKNYAVYNATNIKSVTGNIGTFGLGEVTAEQAKQFGMTADQAKQAQEEGDIRFSLKNIGYHSGDLGYGVDTVLGRMAGSRGTGHFGTGVYFVGKPISREGRPTKIADLSQYNLFKPSFPSSAEGVHNALKLVNRAVGRDLSDEDQRSQYDNDIDEAAMYLDILLRTSFTRPEIKKVIESSVAEARKERTPKIIHTDTYIDSASTRVMKKLGFDGVDVRGLEGFDNTEYGTVVYRESVPEAKEKLSLKKTLPANIAASIEKTTTVREEKGFAERMMEAISPKGFSSWRAEAINRYNALSIADKIKVKKRGGVALYADQSAEAAALMSDNAAGVAASAMGVHDRRGGIPVFKNGVTTIDGSVEGIVSIFAPLAKYKDPFVYQMYQFYSGAKRARRYLDKGIEKNYDANDIAYAEQLGKDYPEFKQIFEKWDKYNKGLVKYQVDTGVLSPAEGAEYIKYADYVPFYRQLEGEKTFGPNVFQSISGVKKPKKYTGGEAPIADFMETIVRNTQSAIQAGMKNTAAKMAVDTFVEIDQAELAPDGSTGEEYVHVLEGGVKKSYLVYDKALVQSVMSLNLPELPFIGFFAGPANLLRNLVTKDPGFMLANMVRDSMSAWVTSGVKMTPVASAIKNFTGALAGTAPEYQALLNAGILGGYDYSQGVEVSAASMKKALGKYAPSTSLDKLKNVPTSLWESLEKGTMASDAATRMEVYKSVLAETGNEAEALYRAMEVMNFNRKGRSAVVRVLTAAVPFLNARIQGLDVLYRAMSGQMGTSDAKKIQKAFFVRGASIMAMSMIYWALTHDEEEYKKQEQETRDNYWLIPSMGIKIPIPFEVGVIFKVIPERIAEYFLGNDTGKDFADSMKRNFMNTFAFNLIPQTVLPIYEAKTNYSFFTQRNIIGAGLEGVAPEYQVGPSTSQLAAFLGKELGYSPMLIDHVIGGYTGTFGSYAVDVIDAIAFAGADVQRPSKRFEQLPIFKRFLLDPQAKGNVTAYYDLKNSVDEAVRTSNFLEKTSNFEELGKYNEETLKVLASKDFISDMEKDMKELREMSTFVRSSTMSPDDKRDMLMSITDAENAMTANVRYLRKLMD
jgi:hypothetical protein